jgi:predicted RNA-binding Zn-ribbon protein involved in translation (DUF1610 family)
METLECLRCGSDAHFDIVDENGAHYTCPNCDHEWCDDSILPEGDNVDE